MSKKLTIIAATKNKHKLMEFQEIFASAATGPIEVISEDAAVEKYFTGVSADYRSPDETGRTFAANALIKAAGIYTFLKDALKPAAAEDILIAADDSGLCVRALNGAPGVLSARYASDNGENASDGDNVAKLLRNMETVPKEQRNASFVCAISGIVVRGGENSNRPIEIYAMEGHLPGFISREARGANGFGYDPVMFLPEYGKSVAELEPEVKNAVSHRGKALRRLADRYYGTY